MAYTALNLGYTPAAGYEYTGTTVSQADWASVPNDTYFFDFDTRQVYYKDYLGGVYGAYAGGESNLNTYNVSSSQWSKAAPATLLTAGSTANGLTFFRDDFRRTEKVLSANKNLMDVSVENKKVVLIDDVLYTGRSVRAALTAIDSYGRPAEIELLTLIDRRFSRHLPIQPDYLGRQVDAIADEKVLVHLKVQTYQRYTAHNL